MARFGEVALIWTGNPDNADARAIRVASSSQRSHIFEIPTDLPNPIPWRDLNEYLLAPLP